MPDAAGKILQALDIIRNKEVFYLEEAKGILIAFLAELARNNVDGPQDTLYMDYGSKELHNHSHMLRSFGKIIGLLLERQIYLNCRIVPGGDHSEASWEQQIPFFMETLMYQL